MRLMWSGLRLVTKATNGEEEKCFWDYQMTSRFDSYFSAKK